VNYAYDALGNLRRKSDFSADQDAAYDYAAANPAGSFCGPNVAKAVTRPDGSQVSFRCDQNGNVLTSSGAGADYPWRSVQYDASNRPVGITSGAYTDWFAYDSNGQRAFEHLRQVDGSNNVLAETVIRRGPRGFEGESTSINVPGSNRTLRHELGDAIVILRTTDSAGGTLNDGRNVEVYYRHTDRLGSPLALSDSTRAFRQTGASATTRRAFDAFGQTRNADSSDRTQPPQVGSLGLAPATRNGFTGHEHLDTLGLIHMNGRVYDYRLGRFLQVDPIIQNPAHSQSLNPYSYIGNNPLSGTDPTGFAVEASNGGCTAMTGSHVCGVNTGAENGVTSSTKIYRDDEGGYLRVTESTGSHGERSFTGVWRPGNGARRQDSRLSSQTDGSKNGASGIDGVERDTFREGAQRAAQFGRDFADAGGKVLEAAAPIDPEHPVESIVAGVVIGKALKVGRGEVGESMRALGRKLGMTDVEIDAAIASGDAERKLLTSARVPNAGGKLTSFVTEEDQVFYRVYSGSSASGAFLTRVPPANRAMAIEGLALPPGNSAEYIQQVLVPAGTRLQRSRALPAFGRRGGLEQFELMDKIPNASFGSGEPFQ